VTLAPGQRLGSYEIVALLGAGGMGEVWRARDAKLDRDVAVKVLPERVASDPAALARFEREARAVAALSHPGILAIHDFGQEDGTAYAVMELLEGETLRQRLQAGPLPPRKAAEYGAQIARALAAAHERGIVHRDLKPDNVFLTRDGVKVLDFGLAHQTERTAGPDDADSPTLSRHTDPGTVMGTAGYMSPEQVRGQVVDHRSDVFSFGCLLYEMAAGQRAFQKETAAETMTAVLNEDPPDLPAAVTQASPGLARIVRHCLEKDPGERFQSARDLAFDLASLADSGTGAAQARPGDAVRRRSRAALAAPLALLAGLAGGWLLHARLRPAASTIPAQVRPLTFSGSDSEPAASPDGRLIAFRSNRDRASRIWIRQMAGGTEAPLTEGPDRLPRFTPDGASVVFIRQGPATQALWRIPLVGGDPRKLLDDVVEADLSPDGRTVAFVRYRYDGARRVCQVGTFDLSSGNERLLLVLQDLTVDGVRWSPDGRTLAASQPVSVANYAGWHVLLIDAASGSRRTVTPAGHSGPISVVAWAGEGRAVVLALSGSVMGDLSGSTGRMVRMDVGDGSTRTLFGVPGLFPIQGQTLQSRVDVLGPGTLVLDGYEQRQSLREAAGAALRVFTQGSSRDRQPRYSPDGEHVVFSSNRSGNLDLWLLSTRTGVVRQLTDDPAEDWDPSFTSDGRQIVWSSSRRDRMQIWMANVDGSNARQVTQVDGIAENPTTTPDGRWIVYRGAHPEKPGIWKVRPDGKDATLLVAGAYTTPEVSPDGRHVAYAQLDRIRQVSRIKVVELDTASPVQFEIVVPFERAAESIVWGRSRWTPDGQSIAYVGLDDQGLSGIFVQPFQRGRDTSSDRRRRAGFSPEFTTESFDISPDGQRVTLSALVQSASIRLAENVPDLEAPSRAAATR